MKKCKIGAAVCIGAALMLSACSGGRGAAEENKDVVTEADTQTVAEAGVQTTTESDTDTEAEMPKPILTLEEYPKVDGSTANLPLMAEVMKRATGISLEQAQELTSCNKTPQAWYNLANGDTDFLLVYEPAQATVKGLEEIGTELTKTPIGNDALVFIVNESNPVENLTTEQIRAIYKGKITNWKELGGSDEPIAAFQRSEESGSQSLFIKLVMDKEKPAEAPKAMVTGLMNELIDSLAQYNNQGNAIGYSVYYYASYMYSQPGLKFISVDGVMPTDETIASGEYPHINPFYAAIRSEDAEKENSPAKRLYDFVTGDEGVKAMRAAGYIPVRK